MAMQEGYAVQKPRVQVRLRLGDHLIQTSYDGARSVLQSAVALLRTVFEDHHVDSEHAACRFFHGCTLAGLGDRSHDFTVVHKGDRVVLSDFTFRALGPAYVSLPLLTYAEQVVQFGLRLLDGLDDPLDGPDWHRNYLRGMHAELEALVDLGAELLAASGQNYVEICEEFREAHGSRKRPLELLWVETTEGGEPRKPILGKCRVNFGPLGAREALPMRLNGGDVVLVSVQEFTHAGVVVKVEGVGSGGIRPGDHLYGLQLFYP